MNIYRFLLVCLISTISAVSLAQDAYFVAIAGNDTNAGTESHPWKTFQKAFNAATPGSTVYFKQGVYNEKVTLNVSGSAEGGYITFRNYGNDTVTLDGTAKSGDQMILIEDKSYIKIIGFELRNNLNQSFGSGIWVKGGGSHIELRNNSIHDMKRTGSGDCMAISVYGTSVTPLSNIIIDNNHIFDCQPGYSEALTLNGNVDTFQITNNRVHDVNNIGIDMIGGEGTAPVAELDAVRNGVCSGNIVYNAHSQYGGGYAAGIYVDGGRNILVERNMSYSNDVGIEIGCENQGRVASGIIVRNNLVFDNDKRGIGVGGYDYPATGKVTTTIIENNTCFKNDTFGTDAGELIIEYTENCVFKNNIFYASSHNRLMTSTVGNASGNILDYNLWYAEGGVGAATVDYNGTIYTGFASYKTGTGQDSHSLFSYPAFASLSLPLPDLHIGAISPAVDAGDPAFIADYGETDYDGNDRISGERVDCGAFEVLQITITTPLLIEPEDNASLELSPVVLRWSQSDSGSSYHLQVATDSLFSSFIVNDTLEVDTVRDFQKSVNGEYFWRVRAKRSGRNGSWSEARRFVFTSVNRWKIVSVNKAVADPRTATLFPTAISHAFAYIPGTGYAESDTLYAGQGYWLKFGADQTANISGDDIVSDTLDLAEGWNLVGALSNPVAVVSVATEPEDLLSSGIFGYNKGYSVVDTLEPGKGYWVKARQAGKIILNSALFR